METEMKIYLIKLSIEMINNGYDFANKEYFGAGTRMEITPANITTVYKQLSNSLFGDYRRFDNLSPIL